MLTRTARRLVAFVPAKEGRMPHSIAVSVVIPAYNAAEFLPDSLASVFRQTYQPQEVLIVDDGSEDETSRVAQALEKRVRYLRKPRGGPASARNLGIRAAQGEWIAFLDADDTWVPERLEQQLALARETGADLVFSDALILTRGGAGARRRFAQYGSKVRLIAGNMGGVVAHPFELLLEIGCFILTTTVLVRRESLLRVGLFDEDLYCGEDMDLWLRLAVDCRFAVVNQPLVVRRVHGRNISEDPWTVVSYELKVCEKLESRHATLTPEWQTLLAKKRAHLYRQEASLYLQRDDIASARKSWARAVRLSGSPALCLYWMMSFLPPMLLKTLRHSRAALRGALHGSAR